MATEITELQRGAVATKAAPKDFPAMLERFKPEIARALPSHLNGDRMARIALTAFRRTPKLGDCDPRSVFAAVIQASQLGLEPDTLGRAYLIPYGKECQFIPGWKGLVDLMNRSGQGSVHTGVIFRDQKYKFTDGSRRQLDVLNETALDDPEDITHAYAVGWIKGVENPIIEFWRVDKIKKHRDRYNKVGKKHYSFGNWEMYARKIPLLQVLKYMPCSAELATAIALNDAAEVNRQQLNVSDAIEGTWVPAPDDGDNSGGSVDGNTKETVATGGNDAASGAGRDGAGEPRGVSGGAGGDDAGKQPAGDAGAGTGGAKSESGTQGAAKDNPAPRFGSLLKSIRTATTQQEADSALADSMNNPNLDNMEKETIAAEHKDKVAALAGVVQQQPSKGRGRGNVE